MIKNKTYLDYLQRKVDNQVGYDCRQKLKEAELQNFFMVLSKLFLPRRFQLGSQRWNWKFRENFI